MIGLRCQQLLRQIGAITLFAFSDLLRSFNRHSRYFPSDHRFTSTSFSLLSLFPPSSVANSVLVFSVHMEALSFARALSCEPSSAWPLQAGLRNIRACRRTCFFSAWGRRDGCGSLTLNSSARASGRSGEHGVIGNPQSRDGLSDDVDDKKKKNQSRENGLVMDAERDSSGSVVSYHLIPPPQTGNSTACLSY